MDASTIEEAAPATISTALAEYQPTAAALADLRKRYANVAFDLTTTKGDREARAARLELVKLRTSLEAKRKELKAPALERSRLIDDEAKRITGAILELETPIDEQIRAAEARKEEERRQKAEAERARIDRHHARIAEIRAAATGHGSAKSSTIQEAITAVVALDVSARVYEEFAPTAESARDETLRVLRQLHADALAREAEAERLAAERAELARQRAEQEAAARAERERIAEEQRIERERVAAEQARIAAEQQAERQRIEAEAAERRRQIEQEQAAARAAQEEADRKAAAARAEADRIAAAERAEADRIAREAREAEERRIAAERAELKRQQDEAARREREAEEARRLEAEAAEAAANRVRDAAPQMLSALQAWQAADEIKDTKAQRAAMREAAAQRDIAIAAAVMTEAPA